MKRVIGRCSRRLHYAWYPCDHHQCPCLGARDQGLVGQSATARAPDPGAAKPGPCGPCLDEPQFMVTEFSGPWMPWIALGQWVGDCATAGAAVCCLCRGAVACSGICEPDLPQRRSVLYGTLGGHAQSHEIGLHATRKTVSRRRAAAPDENQHRRDRPDS